MAGCLHRPVTGIRLAARNAVGARLDHRNAGKFQRIHGKSQKQENVQRFRNRGGSPQKRSGATICGKTSRGQAKSPVCRYRTEPLPLPQSGKTHPHHGGTSHGQKPRKLAVCRIERVRSQSAHRDNKPYHRQHGRAGAGSDRRNPGSHVRHQQPQRGNRPDKPADEVDKPVQHAHTHGAAPEQER